MAGGVVREHHGEHREGGELHHVEVLRGGIEQRFHPLAHGPALVAQRVAARRAHQDAHGAGLLLGQQRHLGARLVHLGEEEGQHALQHARRQAEQLEARQPVEEVQRLLLLVALRCDVLAPQHIAHLVLRHRDGQSVLAQRAVGEDAHHRRGAGALRHRLRRVQQCGEPRAMVHPRENPRLFHQEEGPARLGLAHEARDLGVQGLVEALRGQLRVEQAQALLGYRAQLFLARPVGQVAHENEVAVVEPAQQRPHRHGVLVRAAGARGLLAARLDGGIVVHAAHHVVQDGAQLLQHGLAQAGGHVLHDEVHVRLVDAAGREVAHRLQAPLGVAPDVEDGVDDGDDAGVLRDQVGLDAVDEEGAVVHHHLDHREPRLAVRVSRRPLADVQREGLLLAPAGEAVARLDEGQQRLVGQLAEEAPRPVAQQQLAVLQQQGVAAGVGAHLPPQHRFHFGRGALRFHRSPPRARAAGRPRQRLRRAGAGGQRRKIRHRDSISAFICQSLNIPYRKISAAGSHRV